jgi:hypothetical protein
VSRCARPCELILDGSWLNQLDDVIFGHGISALRGEVEASSTPTICCLSDSHCHQLSAIARLRLLERSVPPFNNDSSNVALVSQAVRENG